MAVDVRECDDMIDACARASVKLQLGFMRRASRRVRYAPTKGGAREADRIGAD
jgi:predicted dehydrogenase